MSLKCVKVDKNWKWFVENGKIALRINDGYKFYSAYRESRIDRALSKPLSSAPMTACISIISASA